MGKNVPRTSLTERFLLFGPREVWPKEQNQLFKPLFKQINPKKIPQTLIQCLGDFFGVRNLLRERSPEVIPPQGM
jgi:hypothetical protein